ncbi:hypothetical protein LJR219_004485 [Phenylobacterium sp. LjRoot219]|uniref:hypothetical protein n=1 Tax=Phenylobacterium sp. LjRoot219 TaxID=3342283 RepID=UPI003ED08021
MGLWAWTLLFIAIGLSAARMIRSVLTGEARCGRRLCDRASAPSLYWLVVAFDVAVFLGSAGLIASWAAAAPSA